MANYTQSSWRLLISPPGSGPWNMAVDESILLSIGSGRSLPTLRLYAWSPACLSLGYAQKIEEINIPALRNLGWDWVRRPTGGRAILHIDELTYSVMAPLREPRVYGSVLQSYNHLAQALVQALMHLGLLAISKDHYPHAGGSNPLGPICFDVPSNYEITVYGKKIIGSAQARRREGILQHGSLPLYGDITRITQCLIFPDESSRISSSMRLIEHAATIETTLGKLISWEMVCEAMVRGFSEALNLDFLEGELTQAEIDDAHKLVQEKYANPDWNSRF